MIALNHLGIVMASNFKSYLKGVGSGYVKILLTMLIGLWMVPFTLKFLDNAEYGVFAIAGDILLWLGLLQLGTSSSLTSRAAQMLGRQETEKLSDLASTALVLQVTAGILVLAAGAAIALNLEYLFPGSSTIDSLQSAFILLAISASVQITTQTFNGLLTANKQIHLENYLGIGLFLLQTLATISLLMMGLKILALAIASLVSVTIIAAIAYWRVRKWMPQINISTKNFKLEHARDLVGNGIWFTIGGLAGILILNTDRLIVGRYVSLEAVTAFLITGKLYFIADKLHGQIFNTIRPYFGQLHGAGKYSTILKIYQAAFSSSLLLSGLMAATIFLLNKWFITSWVGADYYIGDSINFLFSINFVLQSSVLPNRILLSSTLFKVKQNAIFRVLEGVANVALSIFLVVKFGLEGILIASIIASAAFSAVAMNLISRDYFRQSSENVPNSIYLSYLVLIPLIMSFTLNSSGERTLAISPAVIMSVIFVAFLTRSPFFKKFYAEINKKNTQ